jgi:hypothetical protein
MTTNSCVHGIDNRFCSICNRRSAFGVPRGAISSVTLPEILEFLNAEQVRATYGAVGGVIGVIPRALGAHLGARTVEASWIVNGETGLPTDYTQNELHPALLSKSEVISSGIELAMRLSAWKAKRH